MVAHTKMIASTCRRLWSLSARQKRISLATFINLIGWQHFIPSLETHNFSRFGISGKISITINFQFRLFPRKNNERTFQRIQKNIFCSYFGPFLPKFGEERIFLEKRALLVFKYFKYLPSSQRSEKTNQPFLIKMPNWWTDRETTVIL